MLYNANQYVTRTLAVPGGIDDTQTTGIILDSDDGLDYANPGIALLTWADPVDTSVAEWVTYTSINHSTFELQGVTRGAEGYSAHSHDNGATVAFPISESQINNLNAIFRAGAGEWKQIATPSAPASGYNALYFKSDNLLYKETSGGAETAIDLMSGTRFAPEGFLINGKIVPSVASNNLTVAIKGMDGNDPSATNPVYVRLGDSTKTISAALSVTKNAGTNWCNAGGAGLATNEIDYFVYLGYNATDGVVVGFSRIPYGTRYDSFSSTSTAETYCAISTITNAAAGDTYQVIGRFAATLSAGAGYTWTVPTYTTVNLVQRPIFTTRWLTSSAPTYAGLDNGAGAAPTTTDFRYKIEHRTAAVHIMGSGTKDGTNASWDITNPIMAPANTSDNAGVGVANAFNSTAGASLVMATKFISPKFYFSNSANITDNHVISSWGSTFSWEI